MSLIEGAEVLIPCPYNFPASLRYFTDSLGFKVKLIAPADDPAVAVLQGNGLALRLDRNAKGPAPLLLFTKSSFDAAKYISTAAPPEGIRVEWIEKTTQLRIPPLVPSFVLTRRCDTDWVEGRAGMLYRDLVPDCQGGRFICSHIRIPGGGAVPDYVHYHHIYFQMIYCYKGWVQVVYEDQGPPFCMKAGDCVLQPPHIRHRVLSSSVCAEVIEISCPAQHDTLGDPDLVLPTTNMQPDRLFSGQHFVLYQQDQAKWMPKRQQGWEVSDIGFSVATSGLAGASVLGNTKNAELDLDHLSGFIFRFILKGSVELQVLQDGNSVMRQRLCEEDTIVIPENMSGRLTNPAPGTQILEVALPALSDVAVHCQQDGTIR